MSYVDLTTFRQVHHPGYVEFRKCRITLTMGGDDIALDLPLIFLSDSTAIAPVASAHSDDNTIRLHMNRWQAIHVGPERMLALPLVTFKQEHAVRLLRDFQADQTVTWAAPTEQITAWCKHWAATLDRELTTTPNPSC